MVLYGQTAAYAIAVMSYLAADPTRRAGSREIAAARGISQASTAKLLTQLASARLVKGQPGPHGGYTIAKDPSEISLLDIVGIFEQTEPPCVCAFGAKWCGIGHRCPLHYALEELMSNNQRFLRETRLSIFCGMPTRRPEPDLKFRTSEATENEK